MRRPLIALALGLLALPLAGCGSHAKDAIALPPDLPAARAEAAKAPKDAVRTTFCEQWAKVEAALAKSADSSDDYGVFQGTIDAMEKVGTPPGLSAKARKGFEISVASNLAVSYDQMKDAAKHPIQGLTTTDRDNAAAFLKWTEKTCTAS